MNEDIKRRWLQVRAHLAGAKITQEAIAGAAGVSQATVSRILQRCPARQSGAFRRLCIYADKLRPTSLPSLPVHNEELLSALSEVWNGTPEHALALAAMIRAAGAVARTSKV